MNRLALPAFCLALIAGVLQVAAAEEYAILVSKATRDDADWAQVVDVLTAKHKEARVVVCEADLTGALPVLKEHPPRWLCWVAKPKELGTKAVARMHQLACAIDDDPYVDAFWGIITGWDAASARALAAQAEPLVVRSVAANTEFAMECVEQGRWFSELKQGEVWSKAKGGAPAKGTGDKDPTAGLARCFNDNKPDAILTSGHASERDWQPAYSYRGGSFVHSDGVVIGKGLDGSSNKIDSPNPKVYLGIGNCLIGNVPGKPDCMATAWMHSGGVRQFMGYTVPSWYGYAGWGVLDYFLEQPGRFTLTEAFFANQQALRWRLAGGAGKPAADDRRGLEYDRDVVAFYGDPQWEARLAPGALRWTEEFKETEPGVFTWTITPTAGEKTFAAVNTNGSQRGGRPLVRFLPRRFAKLTLLEGSEWQPVLADDFILMPRPDKVPAKIVIRCKGEK